MLLQISNSTYALALPWSQLTKIQSDDAKILCKTLECAKNLDTLMAVGCFSLDFDRPHLEHSKLRQLHFNTQAVYKSFPQSLGSLNLPALEVLVVNHPSSMMDSERDVVPELTSLLVRSECNLKHLVVSGGPLDDSEVLDLLEAAPNLETLELDCSDLDVILSCLVLEETANSASVFTHPHISVFHS